MPYCNVANLVSVRNTNMIDEMTCGYGTVWATGVWIWSQAFRRAAQSGAEVTTALEVSHRPVQRSQLLHNFTILLVKYQSTWECSFRVWEHFAVLQGGLGGSESTYKHWWGRPECHRGLHVAPSLCCIMLMFMGTWEHLAVAETSLGAPTTSLGAPWIAVEQSGESNIFFWNADSASGYHSYYISFKDFYNSCIQFVLVYMYLSICVLI